MTHYEEMNTPAYIYDGTRIRNNITKLLESLPQFEIIYSIKANPYPPLVRYIASQNTGANAASKDDVLLACAAKNLRNTYTTPGPEKPKPIWTKSSTTVSSLPTAFTNWS